MTAGLLHPAQDRRRARPSTASPSRSSRARRSGLVGESGCGKSTTGRCILQLYRPTTGSVLFDGKDLTHARARRRSVDAPQDADDLPGPVRSLNPRMTVGHIIGEPLVIHGLVQGRSRPGRPRPRAAAHRRSQPALRHALPARVLGRPAPAHRHRPRARGRARLHRLRRAGVRARRVDPGADHQPAGGAAGAVRPHLPVHRPRPLRRPSHQRPRRRDVPRQDHGAGRPAGRSTRTRCTRTRRRCSRPCRSRTRRSSASASASS